MKLTPKEICQQFASDVSKSRLEGLRMNYTNVLGRVVANATVFGVGEIVCYLQTLNVIPTMRRCGIGAHLMRSIETLLSHDGTKLIEVTAVPESIGFYEKLGYVTLCDLAGYGAIMAKSLDKKLTVKAGDSLSRLVDKIHEKE